MITEINGEIRPADQAAVSVLDAGFYFGLGLYETLLVNTGVPVFYREHMERLAKAAEFFGFPGFEEFSSGLSARLKKILPLQSESGRLRIVLSPGKMSLATLNYESLNSVIILQPAGEPPASIRLHVSRMAKNSGFPLPSFVKLTSNHKNLMSARLAKKHGADEGLLVNDRGHITEGSFSNVFHVRDGILHTPSTSNNLLSGITREKIILVARQNGMTVEEGDYTLRDLFAAEECFITSSTRGAVPVSLISRFQGEKTDLMRNSEGASGRLQTNAFTTGPVTLRLAEAYRTLVKNHCREADEWR